MRSRLAFRSALLASFVLALTATGCGQPVRQDRHINWQAQGKEVGFQHDEAGVFVADKDGGELRKVFTPGPDVLAASTPLWHPKERRLIFLTAHDPNGQPAQPQAQPQELNPAGRVSFQRPVTYTCWLYEPAQGDQKAKPTQLFKASCNHIGYVSANLAVRWHPREPRILFLDQVNHIEHSLFEFDLRTKVSQPVIAERAEAFAFDWSPDGSRLACVLGHNGGGAPTGALLIGKPGDKDWWKVPNADALAEAELSSLIERVRATLPAWTWDGARFAFTTFVPGANEKEPGRSSLWLGTLAGRAVKLLARDTEPFRDLHWAPDGKQLGVVRGRQAATLHHVPVAGGLSNPLGARPVRRFAGWNAKGDRLAYVVPDKVPLTEGELWAFLLLPNRTARDAVYVAPGQANEAGREVFSGMRVTFPRWSPTEDKLSVWFTFAPTHSALLTLLAGGLLRPGDPAAVFDVPTGQIQWMAVNGYEKAQIGHYHLLKREYDKAWQWYQDARKALPPPPAKAEGSAADLLALRDFTLFEWYCLTKLGREAEARAKLEQFDKEFRPPSLGNPPVKPGSLQALLLRDFYAAEVLLSLDAAADAKALFRKRLADARTDEARLSSAVVLGQILLLEKGHAEYVELAAGTLAPLVQKLGLWGTITAVDGTSAAPSDGSLASAVQLSLLPLYVPAFHATLPEDQVRKLLPRWAAVRKKAGDDAARLTADLVLEAAYERLGQEKERQEAAARLQKNPLRAECLPRGVAGLLEDVRQMPAQLEALRQLLGGL